MAENIDELYMRGREAFDKGDYKEAERCFLDVVKARPYADVFNKLGLIFHSKGELGKAASAFKKALDINPSYTEVSLNLAVTLNDLGRYNEAGEIFSKAAKIAHSAPYTLDPYIKGKLANEHAKIGDMYYDLGLYGEAVEEYKKSITLRPTFIDILTKIGIAYREKGLYNEAIQCYDEVLRINPGVAVVWTNKGYCYAMLNKYSEALECLDKSLEINPEDAAGLGIQEGDVVVEPETIREPQQFLLDGFHRDAGGRIAEALQDAQEPLDTQHLVLGVVDFEGTVAEDQQAVTGVEVRFG